jgi:hypothetical protein
VLSKDLCYEGCDASTALSCKLDCLFVVALSEVSAYKQLGSQHSRPYTKGDIANAMVGGINIHANHLPSRFPQPAVSALAYWIVV